jgi:hypothetical protein
MFPFLILAFAALPFFSTFDMLAPDHNHLYPLPNLNQKRPVMVVIHGDGKSDLDCYILVNKRIVRKDERAVDDCVLSMPAPVGNDITVWVHNNGKNDDSYTMKAYQ